MKRVFLSIGSNIEPAKNIPVCLEILRQKFRLIKVSSVYETDPVGPSGKEKFWNLAVEIETTLGRSDLVKELRVIEAGLGRNRDDANKFAPRTIDLDLLPFPGSTDQPFVMIPLAEMAPSQKDPDSGKTFEALAQKWKKGGWRKINASKADSLKNQTAS